MIIDIRHDDIDGSVMIVIYVFFFQAEDGIRDIGVTGVQTCALPIFSAVRLTRAVLPHMRSQRWGRIINVASESGSQPSVLKPHYNAAKAALINLTKSLSKTYGEYGILVNSVSPATTITPSVENLIAEEARRNNIPLDEKETAFVRD